MLLELRTEELPHLLECQQALDSKINEALHVLVQAIDDAGLGWFDSDFGLMAALSHFSHHYTDGRSTSGSKTVAMASQTMISSHQQRYSFNEKASAEVKE